VGHRGLDQPVAHRPKSGEGRGTVGLRAHLRGDDGSADARTGRGVEGGGERGARLEVERSRIHHHQQENALRTDAPLVERAHRDGLRILSLGVGNGEHAEKGAALALHLSAQRLELRAIGIGKEAGRVGHHPRGRRGQIRGYRPARDQEHGDEGESPHDHSVRPIGKVQP
jgi:hypothetical protein